MADKDNGQVSGWSSVRWSRGLLANRLPVSRWGERCRPGHCLSSAASRPLRLPR